MSRAVEQKAREKGWDSGVLLNWEIPKAASLSKVVNLFSFWIIDSSKSSQASFYIVLIDASYIIRLN